MLGPGEASVSRMPLREDKSTTKVGGSEVFLMSATFTSAAGTSPHQTRELITECLLGMPFGSCDITLSKAPAGLWRL